MEYTRRPGGPSGKGLRLWHDGVNAQIRKIRDEGFIAPETSQALLAMLNEILSKEYECWRDDDSPKGETVPGVRYRVKVCRPIAPRTHRWGPMAFEPPCPNIVSYNLVYADVGQGESWYPLCTAHAQWIARRWGLVLPQQGEICDRR